MLVEQKNYQLENIGWMKNPQTGNPQKSAENILNAF